jgi:hypothetical protein
MDRAHGSVDHGRMAVHRSTVDHGRRRQKGSPELTLEATPVSGSSPAVGERKRKPRGFLPWVRVGGAVLEGGWRWWTVTVAGWSSVWGEWRQREVK